MRHLFGFADGHVALIVLGVVVLGMGALAVSRLERPERDSGLATANREETSPAAPRSAAPPATPPAPIAPAATAEPPAIQAPQLPPAPPPPPPKPPIERMKAHFQAANVPFPPRAVIFAAFKEERTLELYARGKKREWRFVHRYPILGASGALGPKLVEGDRQVPEGIYPVIFLNPNSKFHLSLRLDYPNAFDRKMAAADKRTTLGGDIMIHGGWGSTGCLAMGDPAIEELYALAERVGIKNVKVVIAPFDLRLKPQTPLPQKPDWVEALYENVADELARLPVSPNEIVAEAGAAESATATQPP